MKKLNKVAVLFAAAALAAPIAAFAQAKSIDNWRTADGTTLWLMPSLSFSFTNSLVRSGSGFLFTW